MKFPEIKFGANLFKKKSIKPQAIFFSKILSMLVGSFFRPITKGELLLWAGSVNQTAIYPA